MWIVIASCLIVWLTIRKVKPYARLPAVLLVLVFASYGTFVAINQSGVTRTEIAPETDLVVHNNLYSFPYTIQKIHNWTARMFTYQILFGSTDGRVVFETPTSDDQSEFMHLDFARCVIVICIWGAIVTLGIILPLEVIIAVKTKNVLE